MSIVNLFAKKLNKSPEEVRAFLAGAAVKYRVYSIPKRTYGRRVIAHPSKELKEYQRLFIKHYHFPIHPCAMAYRKGFSIKDNALAHCKHRYLLKMDLENFFHSISPDLFWKELRKISSEEALAGLENEEALINQLLFWSPSKNPYGKLILSIGAPSSPLISNFCLYRLDDWLNQYYLGLNIRYTRYADDLTFSTNQKDILFQIPNQLRSTLYDFFENRIRINHSKTVFSSMAHNRHVTGITINNDGQLSLGRDRKRYIRHLVHQQKHGQLSSEESMHLEGLLAYAQHIEPQFINSINEKLKRAEA